MDDLASHQMNSLKVTDKRADLVGERDAGPEDAAASSSEGLERGEVVSTRIAATSEATGIARRSLDQFHHALDSDLLYELRLLATELVTNCLRHGGLDPDDSIGMDVEVSAARTRVEVSDNGRGFVTPRDEIAGRRNDPSNPSGSGWGLHLIERLSDRWGVELGDSTRVWFEVDTHGGRKVRSWDAGWDLDAIGVGAS